MNLSYLVVHHDISDEAAAHLSELLNDLAFAFDAQYFAQTRRYYDDVATSNARARTDSAICSTPTSSSESPAAPTNAPVRRRRARS